MFNTPVLDITLGLVFIFLLYSLLATSVKEGIATALGLRARMLRRGIIEGMLSDTPDYSRWESIWVGVRDWFRELWYLLRGRPPAAPGLGSDFYKHPLLRNYGSSRIFPTPSYLPSENFSVVLIDTLKKDFVEKFGDIARENYNAGSGVSFASYKTELLNVPDIIKIKNLLAYYRSRYSGENKRPIPDGKIGRDTAALLQMHLEKSLYNIDDFGKKLEGWFNDTMDRVSGWYKRQVQVILLIIGFLMAVVFNVDVIDIATRLSKDDKLRDKLVQSAVAYSQLHQGQGGGQQAGETAKGGLTKEDSIRDEDEYRKEVKDKFRKVDSMVDHDIHDINSLLALGYGDYGRTDSDFIGRLKHKTWIADLSLHCTAKEYSKIQTALDSLKVYVSDSLENTRGEMAANKDSLFGLYRGYVHKTKADTVRIGRIARGYQAGDEDEVRIFLDSIAGAGLFDYEMKNHSVSVKTAYVWYVFWSKPHKWLGFLLLGVAVCLGAPFWFDLLSKIIKLRSAGKKEGGDSEPDKNKSAAPSAAPVSITVNTQAAEEEAVG